jgi:hypothetical protein
MPWRWAASSPVPGGEGPLHHEEFVGGKATGGSCTRSPPASSTSGWKTRDLARDRAARGPPPSAAGHRRLSCSPSWAPPPFQLANGRTARAMAVGLLRRRGYAHVDYASLDAVVEDTRRAGSRVLGLSATQLWVGGANTEPWLAYFLDLLRRQADRAVEAISVERSVLEFTRLQRSILEAVREHGHRGAGLLMSCTGANRNTLKDNLRRLVEKGMLERTGSRRGTRYRLAGAPVGRPPDPPFTESTSASPPRPRRTRSARVCACASALAWRRAAPRGPALPERGGVDPDVERRPLGGRARARSRHPRVGHRGGKTRSAAAERELERATRRSSTSWGLGGGERGPLDRRLPRRLLLRRLAREAHGGETSSKAAASRSTAARNQSFRAWARSPSAPSAGRSFLHSLLPHASAATMLARAAARAPESAAALPLRCGGLAPQLIHEA